MACSEQKIWGYETSWGSFAQFTKVQAQQLLKKPQKLGWLEAASYGLTYFTAYRMLVHQAEVTAGDHVLVWGAAGGLGVFAIQICKMLGANPIAVIGGKDKAQLVQSLGATMWIDRNDFPNLAFKPGESPERARSRSEDCKKFGKRIRELTSGKDVDVVFEHVGQQTFPTSIFVAKRFGKIVICGATTGFDLTFDVRHLWMRQKQILGSHFAHAEQSYRANELVLQGKIKPCMTEVYSYAEIPKAHDDMMNNRHMGKLSCLVSA